MTKQSINTDRVASVANKLSSVNAAINNEFKTMQNKAKQLESGWKSVAGSAAHSAMYRLFNYNTTRSDVLQNYINFLMQQVKPGYENTENINTKLADKFK